MNEREVNETLEPGEPDPPYVDNSPPAAPEELDELEPAFQPRNDVVEEDPDAEAPAGLEPGGGS